MPACEYDEEGNLIECDNCVQNFLLSDSYSCCAHEEREPTQHAINTRRSFYQTGSMG